MDLTAIRIALASQVQEYTGLATFPQLMDRINPPVAFVIPHSRPQNPGRSLNTGSMFVVFDETMASDGMSGAVTVNLEILVLLSEAAGIEREQRALDAYLGIGPSEGQSIPQAINADPTLGGLVEHCRAVGISSYGRVASGGIEYFGSHTSIEVLCF
jgi:hypothetical protein